MAMFYKKENLELYRQEHVLKNEICKSMPVILTIQDTSRCNLRCFMCQRNAQVRRSGIYPKWIDLAHLKNLAKTMWYFKNQNVMDINLFKKIADEVFPYLQYLYLTVSGEVFTNPNFSKEMDCIEKYKTKLFLFTNGTLIPKRESLLRLLRNLMNLIISFDAATKNTYEEIRKGAKYDKVINNIKRFNEYRNKLKEEDRPKLTLKLVLMRKNIEELTTWVELAKQLEADNIVVSHVIIFKKAMLNQSLLYHKKMANYHIANARKKAEELKISIEEFPPLFSESNQIGIKNISREEECGFLWREAFIELDGSVYPCCGSIREGLLMGNIKHQKFNEIWNGPRYQVLRRSFKTGNVLPQCRDCYHRKKFISPDNQGVFILCNR